MSKRPGSPRLGNGGVELQRYLASRPGVRPQDVEELVREITNIKAAVKYRLNQITHPDEILDMVHERLVAMQAFADLPPVVILNVVLHIVDMITLETMRPSNRYADTLNRHERYERALAEINEMQIPQEAVARRLSVLLYAFSIDKATLNDRFFSPNNHNLRDVGRSDEELHKNRRALGDILTVPAFDFVFCGSDLPQRENCIIR